MAGYRQLLYHLIFWTFIRNQQEQHKKKSFEVEYKSLIQMAVLILMKGIFHSSHAPTELNDRGGTAPPVSPEVIKILLFQRSCRLMDAPSEHVISREFCDGSLSK
jgi:hypothetical protein